jgi:hypothetical protein
MMKLVLMSCSLIAANHFAWIDLNAIPHLGEYATVLLVSLILMPWVANQFDT